MPTKIENFNKNQLKSNVPDMRPGDTISVYQKITASADSASAATSAKGTATGKKEGKRIQAFEGLVIARNHGKEANATVTVRKVVSGIGVEKIFPLHSPAIEKMEIVKRGRARRAKLYYLRTAKGKRARLKKEFAAVLPQNAPEESIEAKPQSENV